MTIGGQRVLGAGNAVTPVKFETPAGPSCKVKAGNPATAATLPT